MDLIGKRYTKLYAQIVLVFALSVNAAVLVALKAWRPLEDDTVFFAAIARNLLDSHSYSNPRSPWPQAAAMDRLPGWTSLIAIGMALLPLAAPLVVRLLAAALNTLAAWALARLTHRVSGSELAGLIAGLAYSLYLPGLYLVDAGLSEPSVAALLALSAWAIVGNRVLLGCVLFGLGCLFRGTFILLTPLIPLYVYWRRRSVALAVGALALFSIWPGMWILRNASHGCATLSTISGEVTRGFNNDVVYYNPSYMGYWVVPNDIPGEEKFQSLAKRLSQCGVMEYYTAESKRYMAAHLSRLPVVLAARFYRAYIPIPGKFSFTAALGFGSRGLLFLAVLLTWRRWRAVVSPNYQVLLLFLAGVSLTQSLFLTAGARHTFWLEVMLFPLAASGVWAAISGKAPVPAHQ